MAAMAAIVKIYYTTLPHVKLKSKLKAIINQFFFHKNGNRRFQYVVIGYETHTSFGITLMRHKNTQMQMVAILKIYFSLFLLNRKAFWLLTR